MIASPENWATRNGLAAPTTFLIPTSFARFTDRAVERFMKLMQAISMMNTATMLNSLTYSMRPPAGRPSRKTL